jgi:hypothetical protein
MKTTRSLFATILVALTALVTQGQELVDGLPAWLPIGSDEILINWAVTNSPSWVGAGITYTNTR